MMDRAHTEDKLTDARLLVAEWLHDDGTPPSPESFVHTDSFEARTAMAASQYLQVLTAQGKPRPRAEDIMVSALLGRLLTGSQPLAEPPPLSDGMPWYGIIEDMGPLRCRLEFSTDRQHVQVNGTSWLVDATEGDNLLLRWKHGSPLFKAWPDHADSLPSAWWIGCAT